MFDNVIAELVGVRVWAFLEWSSRETHQYASQIAPMSSVLFDLYDQNQLVRTATDEMDLLV